MSISFLHIIGYLSSLCTSLLLLLSPGPELKWRNHEAALFIFGDSIFDAGTNNYISTVMKADVIPYGESFFTYPTGRFSDGRVIPDFIAEYAGLPLLPPYLQPNFSFDGGVNFASGGSGALVETNSEMNVIDLETQLEQFEQIGNQLKKELGDQKAKETMSKAVYLFSAGGNDLMIGYASSSDISYEGIVSMVIGNVTTVVKSICSKGGRKFGFLNVMPIGCTPYNRATSNGTCVGDLNMMARIYNVALPKALEKLETQLDGFKYSIFDFYGSLHERINDPSAYGLEEGKAACCGTNDGNIDCGGQTKLLCTDPSKYVFFDQFHPTQRVYQQLADLMWNGGHSVIHPYNLRSLFNA